MEKGTERLKTAVVTGAASGIGRAIAEQLYIQRRCRLILVDRDAEGMASLKAALGSEWIQIVVVDLVSKGATGKVLEAIADQPVDILVNCAGKAFIGDFEKMPESEIESVLSVNLRAILLLTRALLPKLLQSKCPSIINLSSLAGLIGAPGIAVYSATKFALVGFSEALASELRGRVHVCVVCPSGVRTNILSSVSKEDGASDGDFADKISLFQKLIDKTGSSPEKVADAVLRAIDKKQELVLLNGDSYVFYYLHRLSPDLCNRLVHETRKRVLSKWSGFLSGSKKKNG